MRLRPRRTVLNPRAVLVLGTILAAAGVFFMVHFVQQQQRMLVGAQPLAKPLLAQFNEHDAEAGRAMVERAVRETQSPSPDVAVPRRPAQGAEVSSFVYPNAERTLTFEYFLGRLSNQLWTLDWALRLALALNRTVVLPEFTDDVCYIGLPKTPSELASGHSLWDLDLLAQAPFRVDLFSGTKRLPAPVPECVFMESTHGKYLLKWAANRAQCSRLHFATSQGLVSPYRTDTRSLDVDPVVVWKYLAPHPSIMQAALRFVDAVRKRPGARVVGIHARSYFEAHQTPKGAKRVCFKSMGNLKRPVSQLVDSYASCKCAVREMTPDKLEAEWRRAQMDEVCSWGKGEPNGTEIQTFVRDHVGLSADESLIVASDHENKPFDDAFREMGAVFSSSTARLTNWPESKTYARQVRGLLPAVFDYAVLMQTDEFFATPGSTFSGAICRWRLGRARELDGAQASVVDACGFVDMWTISNVCAEKEARLGCKTT